jgi:hypothetical protein
MAKIGSLTADLRLESAAFIRDLKKAADATARNTSRMQRDVQRMQAGFAAAGAALKSSLLGMASIVSVGALARVAKQIVTSADDIGDAAAKLGLSSDDLQRFRAAAAQTDVDVGRLDTALKIFSQNLAKGTVGDSTRSLADNMAAVVEQIRQAPTHIEKARIAQEAFGKQWQTGILLAQQSGAEFKRQFENAFVVSERAIGVADRMTKAWAAFENAVASGVSTGFLTGLEQGLGRVEVNLADVNRLATEMGSAVGTALGFLIERTQAWLALLDRINALLPTIQIPTWMGGQSAADKQMGVQSDFWSQGMAAAKSPLAQAAEDVNTLGTAATTATPAINNLNSGMAAAAQQAASMGAMHQMTANQVTSGWLDVAGTVAGAFDTLFKDNKAVAIAMAVINTAQAITAALAQYPPPLSFAMAAAQAAAGAAQIATIASAKKGSSRAPSVRGGGGRGGKGGAERTVGEASGGLQQSIVLQIKGDVFGPEHFRKIVEGINGVQRDGTALIRMA